MNKLLCIFISIFFLSSCDGPKCIDADDFGFEKIDIPATYSDDKLTGDDNQVAPWIETKLKANGDPLTIVVKNWEYKPLFTDSEIVDNNNSANVSAWCPWLGDGKDKNKLSSMCVRLIACQYKYDDMCTNPKNDPNPFINRPCLMKKGIGLYGLIVDSDYDPNQSLISMKCPQGKSFHLGEKQNGYSLFDINNNGELEPAGGVVFKDFPSNLDRTENPSPIYFKIIDSYYGDNSGQYKIVIKSGVNPKQNDPIQYLQELVERKIFTEKNDKAVPPGIVGKIFTKLINNPNYKFSVNAVLTIYVIVTGILFIIGVVNFTKTELIIRFFKIIIISQLLSPNAYNFFYNNLFFLFIDGWNFLQSILIKAGASGPGGDSIISFMLSYETLAKLFSLLFIDWLGWLFIISYFILLAFLIFVYFQAMILILTAKLAIGLMIVVSPIFLCFILFNFSTSFFEGWLKHIISYTLQPLILFTGLTFMSTMIRDEIYGTLGFKICRYAIPNLGDLTKLISGTTENETSLFAWWFPEPSDGSKLAQDLYTIPVPVAHRDPKNPNHTCRPYECFEERYPDLPFLDPKKDKAKIESFKKSNFVNLKSLVILFILIYLLYRFNKFAVQIAKFLVGDGGNFKLSKALETGENIFSKTLQYSYNSTKATVKFTKSSVKKAYRGIRSLTQQNNDVKTNSEELTSKKEELTSKKEELTSKKEELTLQSDTKADVKLSSDNNRKLTDASKLIGVEENSSKSDIQKADRKK